MPVILTSRMLRYSLSYVIYFASQVSRRPETFTFLLRPVQKTLRAPPSDSGVLQE